MRAYLAAFCRIFHGNVSSNGEDLRSGVSASSITGTSVAEGHKYTMVPSPGLFVSATEDELQTAQSRIALSIKSIVVTS